MLAEHRFFDSNQYVERELEKKMILDAVARKHPRVFIFEGDRGVGKSSFLFALFIALRRVPAVMPFIVSLSPYEVPELKGEKNAWIKDKDFEENDLDTLLLQITGYWGINDTRTAGDEARREYLARDLADPQLAGIPILIIDSIYECTEDVRKKLEEYLIAPLVSSGKGYIILSGRGKAPAWSRPELREVPIPLKKFDEKQTGELLAKMNSKHQDKLALIQKLGGGYPLLSKLLGASEEEPQVYLGAAIDILIQETLEPKLCVVDYAEFRRHLEKLSIFRVAFRAIDVENYLFAQMDGQETPRSQTRELISILLGCHIMKYKGGGYIINDSICEPLHQYLHLPAKLEKHCQYVKLLADNYCDMAAKYPDAAEYYQGLRKELLASEDICPEGEIHHD